MVCYRAQTSNSEDGMRFLLLFLPLITLSCGGDKSDSEETGTITVEEATARADERAACGSWRPC